MVSAVIVLIVIAASALWFASWVISASEMAAELESEDDARY